MATPLLCCQCKQAGKLGIQLMPRRLGSSCCTKPLYTCLRWQQVATGGGQWPHPPPPPPPPKQKGACIYCTAGSVWCPAKLALAPLTDRCAAALLKVSWAGAPLILMHCRACHRLLRKLYNSSSRCRCLRAGLH